MPSKTKVKSSRRQQSLETLFSKGLNNLKNSIFPGASFPRRDLIKILAYVAEKFIDHSKRLCFPRQTLTANIIKETVQNIFPRQLHKHAIAEGAKMIFFLESGMLPFHPRKRIVKRPVKTLKPTRRKQAPVVTRPKKRRIAVSPVKKHVRKKFKKSLETKRLRKRKTPISPKHMPSPKRKIVKRKISAPKKYLKSPIAVKRKSPISRKRKIIRSIPRKERKILIPKKKTPTLKSRKKVKSYAPKKKKIPPVSTKIIKPLLREKTKFFVSGKKRKKFVVADKMSHKPTKKKLLPVSRKKLKHHAPRKIRTPRISRKRKKYVISRKKIPSLHRKKVKTYISRRIKAPMGLKKKKEQVTKKKRIPYVSRRKTKPAALPQKVKHTVTRKRKTPFVPKKEVAAIEKKRKPESKRIYPKSPIVAKDMSSQILAQGIRELNKNFEQTLTADAIELVSICLTALTGRLITSIKTSKHVGLGQLRKSILAVFPARLRELALARMSNVVFNNQCS